jgi:hypothetical protein
VEAQPGHAPHTPQHNVRMPLDQHLWLPTRLQAAHPGMLPACLEVVCLLLLQLHTLGQTGPRTKAALGCMLACASPPHLRLRECLKAQLHG